MKTSVKYLLVHTATLAMLLAICAGCEPKIDNSAADYDYDDAPVAVDDGTVTTPGTTSSAMSPGTTSTTMTPAGDTPVVVEEE